jgi:hypothetical protein
MEEYEIKSRLILSASYHDNILFLKTSDGRFYSYNSVPREIFNDFIGTKSPDEFYARYIVPSFSCKRMA